MANLDGPLGEPQDRRDLGDWQLLEVAHDQDLAVMRGQLVEGGSQTLVQLVADHGLAGAAAAGKEAGARRTTELSGSGME